MDGKGTLDEKEKAAMLLVRDTIKTQMDKDPALADILKQLNAALAAENTDAHKPTDKPQPNLPSPKSR